MRQHHAKKTLWARPLADLVPAVIGPVLLRQGFGTTNLILFWDEIVGEKLATVSRPVRVHWAAPRYDLASKSGPRPATLVVRVESGFALDLQHLAPLVIERVNAHLGWRCIARLKLEQGPVGEVRPAERLSRSLDKIAEEKAEKIIGDSVSGSLRQALRHLGARILEES